VSPRYWGYWDGRASVPREAKGGIKARTKRGAFGTSWWARRWVSVLEGFRIGARLGRGRSYARTGQVLAIEVNKGGVSARVQGSRATPYSVAIRVKRLSAAEWKRVLQELHQEARFVAKLLAGEMPRDIEEVFERAGLSLFPAKAGDLKTECSCPDWSNPCKHIAAVYYLLGEEFDRDPFLIFRLRGLDRDELLGKLSSPKKPRAGRAPGPRAEPLPTDPGAFWGTPPPEADPGPVDRAPAAAAPLRQLGPFPFWRGQRGLLGALEPVYRAAAPRGEDLAVGGGLRPPEPGA